MLIDLTLQVPTLLLDVEPHLVVVKVLSMGSDSSWVREPRQDDVIDGDPLPTVWANTKGDLTWEHVVVPVPGEDEKLRYEVSTMQLRREPTTRDPRPTDYTMWDGAVIVEWISTDFHKVSVVGPNGMLLQCRLRGLVTLSPTEDIVRMSLWDRLAVVDP